MRNLWRRARCFIFGHTYVPDNWGWVMCYVCGRQYKPLPDGFHPDDWHPFRPDCTPEKHTHDGPYSHDSETGEQ